MKRSILSIAVIFTLLGNYSCNDSKSNQSKTADKKPSQKEGLVSDEAAPSADQKENPSEFVPDGFVVFDKVYGDLNNDGTKDCVLIIKGTDKSNIIQDEYRGKLDRNRRGIIVLFKKKNHYELAVKNYDCFSSESEDGGVYFPPELSVEIKKQKLYVRYAHGRYGYWAYTFRLHNSDFELIGYDSSENRGPIILLETSINFLTKKKLSRENVNENMDQETGDEIFKETWKTIQLDKRIQLSEIKDFDELDMTYWN